MTYEKEKTYIARTEREIEIVARYMQAALKGEEEYMSLDLPVEGEEEGKEIAGKDTAVEGLVEEKKREDINFVS